jgi:hypothetical protein
MEANAVNAAWEASAAGLARMGFEYIV